VIPLDAADDVRLLVPSWLIRFGRFTIVILPLCVLVHPFGARNGSRARRLQLLRHLGQRLESSDVLQDGCCPSPPGFWCPSTGTYVDMSQLVIKNILITS
jgi:hypothetical protein